MKTRKIDYNNKGIEVAEVNIPAGEFRNFTNTLEERLDDSEWCAIHRIDSKKINPMEAIAELSVELYGYRV